MFFGQAKRVVFFGFVICYQNVARLNITMNDLVFFAKITKTSKNLKKITLRRHNNELGEKFAFAKHSHNGNSFVFEK